MLKKDSAFTMAEVLITLVIIGVVAAMTIPSLLNSIDENGYHVKLKKYYSTLMQAVIKSKEENGDDLHSVCSSFTAYTAPAAQCVRDLFAPYLNVMKTCEEDFTGCLSPNSIHYLNNNTLQTPTPVGVIYMQDGATIRFYMTTTTYYVIIIDVNGAKLPNTHGKDVYIFSYYNNQFFPNYSYAKNNTSCSGTDGTTCAAYYLFEKD